MNNNFRRMSFLQSTALIVCLACYLKTVNAEEAVEGYWVPPGGDAIIAVEPASGAGELRLRILSTLDPMLLDTQNPNSTKSDRTVQGIELGSGFRRGEEWWGGGQLYDPGSGNSYRARFKLLDENTLRLRGYVGFSLLGRSETWTRLALYKTQVLDMLNRVGGGSHDH